jgi:hypothetical protein
VDVDVDVDVDVVVSVIVNGFVYAHDYVHVHDYVYVHVHVHVHDYVHVHERYMDAKVRVCCRGHLVGGKTRENAAGAVFNDTPAPPRERAEAKPPSSVPGGSP